MRMNHESACRSARPAKRGLAMLLAIIAVALTIVMGLALSATRDSTVSTGDSIVRTAAARASAAGCYEVAVALLEQHADIAAGDGTADARMVCEPIKIGNCTISASMIDLETRRSPTSQSLAIEMRVSATVDGVTQTARGSGRIPWPNNVARADLDLSEFALLARDSVTVSDGAVVTAWKRAPLAVLAEPLVIGTTTRGDISVEPSANLRGFVVARPGNFATGAAAKDNQLADKQVTIPADIHVPSAAFPSVPGSAKTVTAGEFTKVIDALAGDVAGLKGATDVPASVPTGVSAGAESVAESADEPVVIGVGGAAAETPAIPATTISTDLVVTGDLVLQDRDVSVDGTVQSGSWRSIQVHGDLTLDAARFSVSVPTQLTVYGNLSLENGAALRATDNKALAIYVGGDTYITNGSYVGPAGLALPLDPNGVAEYLKSKTTLYVDAASNVVISAGGSVMGEVYAPEANVLLGANGTVYGRLCGASISVHGGRLFYDPAMNSGRGYLNPTSGVWAEPNVMRAEVKQVEMLDDASLAAFAVSTGIAPDMPSDIVATAHVDGAGAVDRPRGAVEAVSMTTTAAATEYSVSLNATVVPPPDQAMVAEAPQGETEAEPDQMLGVTFAISHPDEFTLVGTMRDFRGSNAKGGHEDFPDGKTDLRPGKVWKVVSQTLDDDWKPGFVDEKRPRVESDFTTSTGLPIAWRLFDSAAGDVSGSEKSTQVRWAAGDSTFKSWFRDVDGVNLAEPLKIQFKRVEDESGLPRYLFDSDRLGTGGFYPADGRLFGNPRIKSEKTLAPHNTHFTIEFAATATYRAKDEQWLGFAVNDDLWVYVDGQLAVDLGGYGERREQFLLLSRLAERYGWEEGSTHDVRIFAANRSIAESYLRIITNFALEPGAPPKMSSPTGYMQALKVADSSAKKYETETDDEDGDIVVQQKFSLPPKLN